MSDEFNLEENTSVPTFRAGLDPSILAAAPVPSTSVNGINQPGVGNTRSGNATAADLFGSAGGNVNNRAAAALPNTAVPGLSNLQNIRGIQRDSLGRNIGGSIGGNMGASVAGLAGPGGFRPINNAGNASIGANPSRSSNRSAYPEFSSDLNMLIPPGVANGMDNNIGTGQNNSTPGGAVPGNPARGRRIQSLPRSGSRRAANLAPRPSNLFLAKAALNPLILPGAFGAAQGANVFGPAAMDVDAVAGGGVGEGQSQSAASLAIQLPRVEVPPVDNPVAAGVEGENLFGPAFDWADLIDDDGGNGNTSIQPAAPAAPAPPNAPLLSHAVLPAAVAAAPVASVPLVVPVAPVPLVAPVAPIAPFAPVPPYRTTAEILQLGAADVGPPVIGTLRPAGFLPITANECVFLREDQLKHYTNAELSILQADLRVLVDNVNYQAAQPARLLVEAYIKRRRQLANNRNAERSRRKFRAELAHWRAVAIEYGAPDVDFQYQGQDQGQGQGQGPGQDQGQYLDQGQMQ
ncbi:hypothetical protein NKR23_g9278 [Pleurostoma richardsiae]|uniref:Uncharacterized protein n=1 Tax=Pleurostoma richardsiae TaxID=41990 RepID=A0AA38RG00_9PEZI|nr:hypothetical protein NKR23_g9278 [Pleurostoma richardsiae]